MGRPTTTRILYQVMSDSEAKPSPIGEGTDESPTKAYDIKVRK